MADLNWPMHVTWDVDVDRVPVLPQYPETLAHFEVTITPDTWFAWRVLNADPD